MSAEANKGMRVGDGAVGTGGWGIPPIRLESPECPKLVAVSVQEKRVTQQELRPRETRRGAWVGVAVLGWSLEPEPSRVSQQGSAEMP